MPILTKHEFSMDDACVRLCACLHACVSIDLVNTDTIYNYIRSHLSPLDRIICVNRRICQDLFGLVNNILILQAGQSS